MAQRSWGGRRRARRTVIAIAVAAVALTACVADLGSLGGTFTRAAGIASDGTIVGTSRNAAGFDHAFLWDPATGTIRDLGTPGGVWSHASDANNSLIVGWVDTAAFESVGVVWDRDGHSAPLRHDGFDAGLPLAIDASGLIAGYLFDFDAPAARTGAVWVPRTVWGPAYELHTFALTPPTLNEGTTAEDVNGHLQAVGNSGLTPFVWDPIGGVHTLDVPVVHNDPAHAHADAINDAGDIVGSYRDGNGDQQSAVWDATTRTRRAPADPGGVSSYLVDVNNSGMAIGLHRDEFPALSTSYCVSLRTGRITELGDATVTAINDDGVITGLANGRAVRWSADTCSH